MLNRPLPLLLLVLVLIAIGTAGVHGVQAAVLVAEREGSGPWHAVGHVVIALAALLVAQLLGMLLARMTGKPGSGGSVLRRRTAPVFRKSSRRLV